MDHAAVNLNLFAKIMSFGRIHIQITLLLSMYINILVIYTDTYMRSFRRLQRECTGRLFFLDPFSKLNYKYYNKLSKYLN